MLNYDSRARARSYNIVRLSGPPAIPLPRKYEITGQFSFAFRYLCRVIRRRLRYRKMKTKKKNIVDICLDIYIYVSVFQREIIKVSVVNEFRRIKQLKETIYLELTHFYHDWIIAV